MFSIQKALKSLPTEHVVLVNARLKWLKYQLFFDTRLCVRDDSRLVFAWLIGEFESYENLRIELCIMDYLYRFTSYPSLIKSEIPLLEKQLIGDNSNHPFFCLQCKRLAYKYGIPMCKLIAIGDDGPIEWIEFLVNKYFNPASESTVHVTSTDVFF